MDNNNLENSRYYKNVLSEIYKTNLKKNIDKKTILNNEKLSLKYQSILINNLYIIFNNIHGLNIEKRLWKILIGHWLFRYCNIFISRDHRINLLLKKNIKNFYFSKTKPNYFLTKSTSDIIKNSNNDLFNSYIYKSILKNKKNIKITELDTIRNRKNYVINFKSFFKKFFLLFQKINKKKYQENNYLLYHTYLNEKLLNSLNKIIKQKNLKYLPDKIEQNKINPILRKKLTKTLFSKIKTKDLLLRSIIYNLFNAFPSIYLENFTKNFNKINNSHWPSRPKLIFTSNSFDTDEYFKFYVINKIHNFKTKYFCGQHGNNCGTFITRSRNVEQDTSDIFLTWGWQSKFYKNHVQLFNFRQPDLRKSRYISHSLSPLFVLDATPHDFNLFDEPHIFNQKIELFFDSLNKHYKNKVIYLKKYNNFNYNNLILRKYEKLNIKFVKNLSIFKFLKENEIFVFLYDSTGFLEMININKPCLMYLDTPLSMYYLDVIRHYKNLIASKIIFDDLDKLFLHLNNIENNVEKWWNSNKVQTEINKFRKVYSSTSTKPVDKLSKVINYNAK